MFLITVRLLAFGAFLPAGAEQQKRWREELLDQARERILGWYADKNLLEPPSVQDRVSISMLKEDMPCGGDDMPVTYAEYVIRGVRPIDVFNTMLDTPKQKLWNPQVTSVTPLGDWKSDGARAWAMIFELPLLGSIEILQWQVADANFTSEEFWLVFSTQDNAELKKKHPLQGVKETQNCLGAYHIKKHPEGVLAVVTQHVNPHIFVLFPMHAILKFFPPGWKGTLDFIHQLENEARKLNQSGSPRNYTDAPRYMLESAEQVPSAKPELNTEGEFPTVQPSDMAGQQNVFSYVWAACGTIAVSVTGFALGRYIAGKISAATHPSAEFRGARRISSGEELVDVE